VAHTFERAGAYIQEALAAVSQAPAGVRQPLAGLANFVLARRK